MEKKTAIQELALKISKGASLEEAAEELGIPIAGVLDQISEKVRELDTANWQLRVMAQQGLRKSMTKLQKIMEYGMIEPPDDDSDASHSLAQINSELSLEAAKALAKVSFDSLKLSMAGTRKVDEAAAGNPDLFDVARSPWTLKKVE